MVKTYIFCIIRYEATQILETDLTHPIINHKFAQAAYIATLNIFIPGGQWDWGREHLIACPKGAGHLQFQSSLYPTNVPINIQF